MNRVKWCALAIFSVAVGGAFAESGVFTNTAASVVRATLKSTAQWTNESGVAVSSLPFSNAAATSDTAEFSPCARGQEVELSDGNKNLWFGTLRSTTPVFVKAMTENRSLSYTFSDPNDFTGVIFPELRYLSIESMSTADFTPTFDAVGTDVGVRFSNTGAKNAGVVRVKDVFGNGQIAINARASYTGDAKGTVEICKAGPWLSALVASGNSAQGGVAFRGQPDRATAGVPGSPWMHVDANVGVTLDGQGKVTKWADVRGEGYPYADPITRQLATNTAEKPTVRNLSGLDYIDFGANSGRTYASFDGAENTPTAEEVELYGKPAALKWSEARTDIKAIFYVFQDTQPSNTIPWSIGCYDKSTSDFARGELGALFAYNKAVPAVKAGRVAVDGVRVAHSWSDDWNYRPHLVSVSGVCDLSANAFAIMGAQCGGPYRTLGGVRLGEVLVYTNVLTEAEVAQVERYLLDKWIPTKYHQVSDLDGLFHGNTTVKTALSVNGEGEFAVRDVRFTDTQTGIVKDGEGTFVADSVAPKNLPISVNGGAFKFRNLTEVLDDMKPADGPYLWLDASKPESMTTEDVTVGEVTTSYVTRWNDWRPGFGMYCTPVTDSKRPTVVSKAQNGLSVIDFGPQSKTAGQYAAFNILPAPQRIHGAAYGYQQKPYLEGFIVYRKTASTYYTVPLNVADQKLRGQGDNVWGDRSSSGEMFMTSNWRLNGKSLNYGEAEQCPQGDVSTFSVIGCAAARRYENNVIDAAKLGANGDVGGGMQIAEVVYYKRRLTAAERRNTEAYLMKKWGIGEHPEAGKWTKIPRMTFGAGVKPEFGSDTDIEISELSAADSSFSKDGEGKVTLANAPMEMSDYSVRGGELAVDYQFSGYGIIPAFHIDAGDANASHVVYKAGTTSDEIEKFYDFDGNGKHAAVFVQLTSSYPRHVASKGEDGLLPGSKYIDFLEYRKTPDESSAAMRWNLSGENQKNWDANVKEVHLVFAKSIGCQTYPFGNGQNETDYDKQATPRFTASGNKMFVTGAAESRGKNGCTNVWCLVDDDYMWRNNAWSDDDDYEQNDQFHVVTFVMRNGWTMRCSNFAGQWGSADFGGMRIAEAIVFDGTNSTLAAQALHSKLLKKWMNIGDGQPKGEVRLGALTADAGAKFTLASTLGVSVTALSGEGAFDIQGGVTIRGTEAEPYSLSPVFTSRADCTCVTVNGAVVLPEHAVVTLTGVDKPASGWYPVFTATTLAGDVSKWTVDASAMRSDRRFAVRMIGNQVGIEVLPPGMAIIVR